MTVDEYAYWGGLIQAEGLTEYVENFRRRMFDSAGACFWMFNDCWPTTVGWTIADYYLRRTPGFWAVRRAMAPVHVVLALEDGSVNVYGINDSPHDISGDLVTGFFRMDGPASEEVDGVTLRSNAATLLRSIGRWQGEPQETIAFATLQRRGHVLVRNRLILPAFRELRWARPDLSLRAENGNVIFESDAFVWGVCIDLAGERALPDNFFDIWPGIPYTLPWPDPQLPGVLHTGNLVGREPDDDRIRQPKR